MRNNVASFWVPNRIDRLKNMWAAGQSGSEIAASFGTTRCAVLGKIFRLGLPVRAIDNNRLYQKRSPEQLEATKRLRAERRNERRRDQPPRLVMVKAINLEALRCIEVIPLHKDLVDLGPNDCRFPYGEGPYTFCGNPQMEGRSYCGPHTALSFRRLER